jgi:hypothetical protein
MFYSCSHAHFFIAKIVFLEKITNLNVRTAYPIFLHKNAQQQGIAPHSAKKRKYFLENVWIFSTFSVYL